MAVVIKCVGWDRTLTKRNGDGSHCKVRWTQTTKGMFGCEKEYWVTEYVGPEDSTILLYTASECGSPPESFRTSGHKQGGGCLHFAVNADHTCIVFVLHPPDWKPFQKRFPEMSRWYTKLVAGSGGKATGTAAGALAGTVLWPGVGTAVGAGAGLIGSFVADTSVGDYLRYIG
eukprot:CAMPEP_0181326772 /NCGR_PEP_ID=MMETSP1101-20121128/21702_1 /TAXON_ID=46948 /ORGANISM="Rhodomonas abbreviata, Strain Caron Lab Isolate" /LENGTH=172 /DNA_ID=CAMNT_0023435299 /DNA_START=132 /DNA_END=650 /DNA_ORIENTATION=+